MDFLFVNYIKNKVWNTLKKYYRNITRILYLYDKYTKTIDFFAKNGKIKEK